MEKYDFSGWVTRTNVKCSDGRTIMKDAFKHCDGKTVPLVWNHRHGEVYNVLGNVLLQHRDGGVYGYASFNDTESGEHAKKLVEHGDICALSICANQLKERGTSSARVVFHGMIREVSLVLAGSNPEAFIDDVIIHSDDVDGEAYIYTTEDGSIEMYHAEEEPKVGESESKADDETVEEILDKFTDDQKQAVYHMLNIAEGDADASDETENAKKVISDMSEKQQDVAHAIIGAALKQKKTVEHSDEDESEEIIEHNEESEGGDKTMKFNAFDKETQKSNTLSHADFENIVKDAKRLGSMREAVLAHSEELMHSTDVEYSKDTYGDAEYGIAGADNWLFPEARLVGSQPPEFISRKMEWVSVVMRGVHHTPFSRIKSMFADITEDEARAKGYIKGKLKKEEVFTLLKRTTTPTTIYKKQKMDRDDLVDITDFDVITWLKSEMRMMLDEEIARAILIGDGRLSSDDDKINEQNIRPIWKDEDLFTIKAKVSVAANATESEKAKALIRGIIKSKKNYRGSGNPTMFTTEDTLTDMLLLEDGNGRIIYDSMEKLKSALRVSNIVTVPVMEGLKNDDGNDVVAIIVNLKDYNVGADKGGAVNMFDDFDIDYNQQKYLIETRCSGAMIKPFSAIAVEMEVTGA